MRLDHAAIAAKIPHSGSMCLLHGVLEWDATTIRCIARSHRSSDNPLRVGDQLPVLCGIEYAAQAMAIHGALSGLVGDKPRAGYLAGLRDIQWRRARLDAVEEDLIIVAEQVMGAASLAVYQFTLSFNTDPVLQGRATVVLDAERAP